MSHGLFIEKVTIFTFAILILAICTGCSKGSYQHISAEEAAQIMASEKNYIIVDVRTQEEYDKKHIPGAVLVPIDEIKKGNLSALPDKNQTLLIYCWTGRRAEDSAVLLAELGYKNIYEFGGLVSWTGELEGEEIDNSEN